MSRRSAQICLWALVLWVPSVAWGCPRHPLAHAKVSAKNLTSPRNLALVASAAAAPWLLAPTGADHSVRVFTQREAGGRYDLEAVSVVVPFALAGASTTAYALSAWLGDCTSVRISVALMQATLLASLTSNTLKWLTGREYPTGRGDPFAPDRLDDPGRATRAYGPVLLGAWPSGHAATSFAFAAALRTALPKDNPLRFSGYLIAAGVGLGMVWGDHHWLSDVVSGALLGEALGSSFGDGGRQASPPAATLVPTGNGLALVGSF